MPDSDTADGDEYRPTDWLATVRLSYGYGHTDDQAIQAALRHAGPFSEDDDVVTVHVWELYADSWQTHGPSGPERGAEQISFRELELDPEQADRVADHASEAHWKLDQALDDADVVQSSE